MSETRQRRAQGRQQRRRFLEESLATLPKFKRDFKQPPPPPSPNAISPIPQGAVDEDETTKTKAQRLVQSQRESVEMLTLDAERLEAKVRGEEVMAALDSDGYFVVEDLLTPQVVQQMQAEGESLLRNDERTLDRLGRDEFVVGIAGGSEQYPKCPRSVEWVVSVTRKLAAILNSYQQRQGNNGSSGELNDRACSRAMARVFDRSSLKASLQLLLSLADNEEQKLQEALDNNIAPPPFQTIVDHPGEPVVDDDLRKVSVFYFLVPGSWNAPCGGHLSFQNQRDSSITTIEAQRNRMVIWKSDTAMVRREPFLGNNELTIACGLELHLVEKQ